MKRILFVDDSATMRKIAEMVLESTGYQLFLASDLTQSRLIGKEQRLDLIIVDAGLPEAGAYQLAKNRPMKEGLSYPIPVLLLTSDYHPYDEAKGKDVGIEGIVKKPFESRIFLGEVEALLSGNPGPQKLLLNLSVQASTISESEEPKEPIVLNTSAIPVGIPQNTPPCPRLPFLSRAPLPGAVFAALEQIARKGSAYEAVAQISVDAIAQIAWEVVPALAKVMLQQELSSKELAPEFTNQKNILTTKEETT